MDLKRKNYQRNSSWNAPYTFSGKEKDVETGYGYFGARYYDSGLSIWLSVDPMSDKYPSMSPYNYCANNPVKLIDPNGMEIDEAATKKDPPVKSFLLDNQNNNSDVKPPFVNPQSSQESTTTAQSGTSPKNNNTNQTSSQNSSQSNNAKKSGTPAFGFSVDITGALSIFGFTGEIGCLWDSQLNFSFFKSTGKSALFEGSVGVNAFIIPKTDFKLKDFEGLGFNANYNFPYNVSACIFGDFATGAMRDYYFNNYGGFKIGFGLGYGGSISTTTTKLIKANPQPGPYTIMFQMCPL
jgi:RHS repeat-associated protein